MTLTILNVGYPLAPVREDAVGGAEQVLYSIDAALAKAGHRSIVIGYQGSRVNGQLLESPAIPPPWDGVAKQKAQEHTRRLISAAVARFGPDLIHLHGADFFDYLPDMDMPILVTLHLPPGWYPEFVFRLRRPNVFLHCVSAAQRRECPAAAEMLPHIDNGVQLPQREYALREYALALGRICPEKGFHIALDAARWARVPMLLAGEVFPYQEHVSYFEHEIVRRLDSSRRFIGPVAGRRKRRLLGSARCLLAPSLAPETSSLVALEAMAAGTPVIAFDSGALSEIVDHGRTGFIVNSAETMAEAMTRVHEISREACGARVRERFSVERMTSQYLKTYQDLTYAHAYRQAAQC